MLVKDVNQVSSFRKLLKTYLINYNMNMNPTPNKH